MKVDGKKIKTTRRAMRLSQIEVSKGICTQETINKIEIKNKCDSISIFCQICTRLNLSVDECIDIEGTPKKMEGILNQVATLCNKGQYSKGYELLSNQGERPIIDENLMKTKYLYYQGLVHLYGKKRRQESLYYFYQGDESTKEDTIYTALCLKEIGHFWNENLEPQKAFLYYEKAKKIAVALKLSYPFEQCEIYDSCARFFATIGNYEESLAICQSGLRINRLLSTTYHLAELLYEQAMSLEQLGKYSAEEYREAYYIARYLGKEDLVSKIEPKIEKWPSIPRVVY
uniref:helix-turn-helix domain-containing protein n=1 Tax=Enterococcus faecalis TaxID=1351 RepID=UPI0004059133|nr:helix-turn-helix transcriptional regulator [Enterococcus faecalis]